MLHGAFNSNITDKEEIFCEINHIHDLEGRQGNLFLLAVKNMYIKFEIQMSVPNFLNCTKTQYTHKNLMPCPFTGPKMFCAGPNILSQPKNLTAFSASHKHFVPDKKMICFQ